MRARFTGQLIGPVVAAMLLVCQSSAIGQPAPLELAVTAWSRDVERHEPGEFDAAVQRVVNLSWTELRPVLNRIASQGDDVLILRSTALLTDVAVHVPLERRPRPADDSRAIIAEDGERRGVGWLDPHLSASRRLIDRLVRDSRSPRAAEMRANAIAWYRAVSAELAGRLNLADLGPHVQRSLEVFADDAGIQFDAACYFESFASPQIQASMVADRPARPSRRQPHQLMEDYATSSANLLRLAEKHFLEAVRLDPSFVEARVRLGRVLTLRDRAREAVSELRQASEMAAGPRVTYFNALFLGRALEETGDTSGAANAYESAAAMFPAAQSPQLALSRLAAENGNETAAWTLIDRHFAASTHEEDPWWIYHRGTGRDAAIWLKAFCERVRAATIASASGRAR
jgi:hypothetical protein